MQCNITTKNKDHAALKQMRKNSCNHSGNSISKIGEKEFHHALFCTILIISFNETLESLDLKRQNLVFFFLKDILRHCNEKLNNNVFFQKEIANLAVFGNGRYQKF
jgi:hypothetical protein